MVFIPKLFVNNLRKLQIAKKTLVLIVQKLKMVKNQ